MHEVLSALPKVFRIRQQFVRPRIDAIESTVIQQIEALHRARPLESGQSVAIAVGSRGIANLPLIVRSVVTALRSHGAEPFIVPAMGSHGGATADGQQQVLHALGVSEASCGCPIRSCMETVVVSHAAEGFPITCDKLASQADHMLLIARVKPHTRFTGAYQSGLWKMLLIGLGKQAGAINFHRALQSHSLDTLIRGVAEQVVNRCNLWGGVAVVENAYDETALIEGVPPSEFMERDAALLVQAADWMPRLPFRQADLLLVDQIGKDISGSGLDTNVVGRKQNDHVAGEQEWPKIKRIAVRRLTEATGGNALGIGIAEFCRTQAVEQIDCQKTWLNRISSAHPTAAMVPIHYPSDQGVLLAALATVGLVPPEQAEFMWIEDTLHLAEVVCSAAYWDQASSREDLEVLTPLAPLPLDDQGDLPVSMRESMA